MSDISATDLVHADFCQTQKNAWAKDLVVIGPLLCIVCLNSNVTKVWDGHFKTISGHFFAIYIEIFHKIWVLTVIMRG
jgi:hypothetical protein